MPKGIDIQCIEKLIDHGNIGAGDFVLLPVCMNTAALHALNRTKADVFMPPPSDTLPSFDDFCEWWKDEIVRVQPFRFDVALVFGKPQRYYTAGTMVNETYARLLVMLDSLPIDCIVGMVPNEVADVKMKEIFGSARAEARGLLMERKTGELEIAPDPDYSIFCRQA